MSSAERLHFGVPVAFGVERARFVEFVDVRLPDMRFASVAGLSAQGFGADHVGIER